MTRKQVESQHRKRKPLDSPSTGQGAASALDALIKRRAAEPAPGRPPPQGSRKS